MVIIYNDNETSHTAPVVMATTLLPSPSPFTTPTPTPVLVSEEKEEKEEEEEDGAVGENSLVLWIVVPIATVTIFIVMVCVVGVAVGVNHNRTKLKCVHLFYIAGCVCDFHHTYNVPRLLVPPCQPAQSNMEGDATIKILYNTLYNSREYALHTITHLSLLMHALSCC